MSENEGLAEADLLLFILESKQKPFSSNANVVFLRSSQFKLRSTEESQLFSSL